MRGAGKRGGDGGVFAKWGLADGEGLNLEALLQLAVPYFKVWRFAASGIYACTMLLHQANRQGRTCCVVA